MSDRQFSQNRRRLLRQAVLGVAAAPLTYMGVRSSDVLAQDMPQLSEDNPQAKALNYVHDATDKDDMRQADAICANCQLYTGASGEQWGGCSIFPGKVVNADGWCSAWAKAAG